MRIDKLEIKNFKKFAEQTIELHPQFNLLVGDNGSGKTTILDALAVALNIWLENASDVRVHGSLRPIQNSEIRLQPLVRGDRVQFEQCRPAEIKATGRIADQDGLTWFEGGDSLAGFMHSRGAKYLIQDQYSRAQKGEEVLFPVLAAYGAGRRWLAPRNAELARAMLVSLGLSTYAVADGLQVAPIFGGSARRWAAFIDCLQGLINSAELRQWFLRETLAAANRGGRMRPGFEVVRHAIMRCIPECSDVYFSPDVDQIVLSIQKHPQPFGNLSAGQQVMLALVADIAIKVVTQNAHLLPPDQLGPEDEPLPRVLHDTPGVVLIDELDVHLHPSWQRRVAADLKATFPAIQFVCTSHSPQVIGELSREEILLLREEEISHPQVALGADSNWILDHVMDGAASENAEARALRERVEEALDEGDLPRAQGALAALRAYMKNGVTSAVVGLQTRLATYEDLAEDSEESDGGGTP